VPYKTKEARRTAELDPIRREKRRAKDRARYQKNPEFFKEKRREWDQRHPNEISARSINPDTIRFD
jgi:hypothetical protein